MSRYVWIACVTIAVAGAALLCGMNGCARRAPSEADALWKQSRAQQGELDQRNAELEATRKAQVREGYGSALGPTGAPRDSVISNAQSGIAPVDGYDSVLMPDDDPRDGAGPRPRLPSANNELYQNFSGAVVAPRALVPRMEIPAKSLPSAAEEIWVIQKFTPGAEARDVDGQPVPGSGTLVALPPGKEKPTERVSVPLKHTDVKAAISGHIASVDVKQQFKNPYDGKIEAVYVFPLPTNAAVNEFVMTVGERKIRGIVREREEAKQIYEQARAGGHVASLLTQERPNVFTQKVANIEPGKAIDIDIRYFHTLGYDDGWYEFVFPMVVGPRFNPPGTTDGVGSVGQGHAGVSAQKTEVQYLRPEQRNGHDIVLSVDLNAGVPLEKVESRNHAVEVKRDGAERATIALNSADNVPNKDFVLRFKVAGEHTKSGLIAAKDDKGQGYFTLMLIPPANIGSLPPRPLEMVFTLDVSGSMNGQPLAQSKSAMRYALTNMGPNDTFQIVQFAGGASQMAAQPLSATPDNVRQALAYIENTQAGGGTMMLEGIRASLDFPHDENRLRFVTFLTDGYIGNEAEILKSVKASLGPARVFSFGVGNSTNRYLLDGLARNGRGAVAYLGLNDDATPVMAKFYDRIRRPALTDVKIDWGGMRVSDVYPREIPDLFVGRPVVLTGKFTGDSDAGKIKIRGRVGNETQEIDVPVRAGKTASDAKALPAVWARMKIADLADEAAMSPTADVTAQVKQVALEYGLMSSFTSFVAVDSMTRTAGAFGTSVPVPVPVPEGVRYETAVQGNSVSGRSGE